MIGLVVMPATNVHADYQSTVQNDHPVAFYPINSSVDPTGTTATDLSGNGNNGTYNGTDPEFNTVPGPTPFIPDALYFDGFTSFIDLSTGSNPNLLNFSGPITLEAWVQPANSTEGPANIIAKGYESSVNAEITLRANAGSYFGGSYNGNTHGADGGQQTTNWAYVVCAYDGTNWSLYVNSVLVQRVRDTTGALTLPYPWRIGTGSGNYGSSRYFTGNLCEVAMYTNGLTAAQVLNHYYFGELNSSPTVSVPIIVTQPQPQSTYMGGSVSFSVSAVSAFATTNQWLKNGDPLTGQTNSTLTLENVQPGDAVNYSVVVGNINGTTNSFPASLSLFIPANLEWSANANSGVWDTSSSANWVNLADSAQTVFNPGDQVLFDDTIGAPTAVTVNGSVAPSLITVNSSTNSFTISSGTITGTGSLVKSGSSTLTIFNSGNLTGPVTISGGSIFAGNNTFNAVASITITNNATLDLGGGALNGNKPITVSGIGVNGEGAIVNSYNDNPLEALSITLAGDTTFGGSARWDLIGGSISGPHKVTVNWNNSSGYGEWNTMAIAANVGDIELTTGKLGIKYMGSTFGNPASNFTVDSGTELDFWTGDSGYAKNFHVLSGGLMQILTGFTNFSGNLTLENGATFIGIFGSGNQSIDGTITLNGVANLQLGDGNFIFTNVISGTGGFVWNHHNHEMILQASNTYSGPTIIGEAALTLALAGNGSISHSSLVFLGGSSSTNVLLDVSGRPDETLTLADGQTLAGIGAINGKLTISPGATLSPAGSNTTIGITTGTNATGTISAAAVTLNGTTIIKVNGLGVNDQVQSGASITYGGTLNLLNISATPLAAGNSFQVFNTPVYNGSFANITPVIPGVNLAWNLSQLNLGIVSVMAAGPAISNVNTSGGNLIFSGKGGTTNGSYIVLTTTNIATPFANWTPLETNNFDSDGFFQITNPIIPGTLNQYYRLLVQRN